MRLLLLLALFAKSLRTTGCLAMPSRMLREHWRWVIPAAWVLMSYLIGDYTSSHAVEKRRELLASMCDERACMLQCQVNANMNCLQELAICASTLDHSKNLSSAINQMTFARYSERTVWVNQTERQQFERRQTWCINKQSPSPSPSPRPRPRPRNAEVRKPADEYSPVIFAHDTYNYKHIISFDLLSGSDDRDSVLRARESGKGVLTAPFKLLNNRIGVLLTFALYKYELPPNARPQERIQAAIGYLGGILDIEWLIDNLLRQLGGKQSITVNVYDTTYERPLSMHGSNDIGSGMCHVSPLCHVSTLNFGDPSRKHEMHCRFIQSPPWPWMAVENSDMISVGLRKMTGNNDSSGQQQHWYLHISSKYQEKATEMQNGTAKPHQPAHMSHKNTVGLWIALVSVTVLVLGIAVVWVLLWCNRSKRVQQNELELSGGIIGPRRFQLYELVAATSNFAYENKLGQGGFGPVYKGYLQNQDCHVAIKVLSSQQQSVQGLREFNAEVTVMTQLRHRNIVNLVGWCECDSQQQLLLVYELMAQGSLDKHLYDPEEILTWQQRYKIVLDLGNALLYLHRDCEKCIVHGDIKPANVMLDVSYNAKLGDFGLARFIEHGEEPRTTQVIAGTPGYIDPEFIANRWPRAALDVYSFGVVLLEIACGKRPASRQPNGASSLLAWVLRLYDQGMILDAADQRLNGEFDQRQMERVLVTGLWCAHRDPIQRPSIEQAMDVLRSADAELPVLRAVHDERHIRAMEEQAYGDLPVEDHPVHTVTTSTYFTSKDSAYLLAQE